MDISEVYYFAYLKLKDMWDTADAELSAHPSVVNLRNKQNIEEKISFVSQLL